MFKTIANAWKMPDIRKKILFTLLMLLVYRIGAYIPVPGVNVEFIANQVADYDVLGFLNLNPGVLFGRILWMHLYNPGQTASLWASCFSSLVKWLKTHTHTHTPEL